MEIVLAPDVYVNAAVALGSPPARVVKAAERLERDRKPPLESSD